MDAAPKAGPLDEFVTAAIDGGVDMVQLRERRLTDAALLTAARTCARVCHERKVPFLVNDRPDLALLCEADGVHVGQDDISAHDVRKLVGTRRIIGLSTHSPAQIESAAGSEADYIGVGPIYATPTKPGRPAVGVALVRYACQHSQRPFFPIGGIDQFTIAQVMNAGASCASAMRCITNSENPRQAAAALRAAMRPDTLARGETMRGKEAAHDDPAISR